MIVNHINYFKKSTKKNVLLTVLNSHTTNDYDFELCPRHGSVNTSIVALAVFHTRYAVTAGAHFGRKAHFTRPSLTITNQALSCK